MLYMPKFRTNKKWERLNKIFDDFVRKIIRNPDIKISKKEWRRMDKIQKECYKTEGKILRLARQNK